MLKRYLDSRGIKYCSFAKRIGVDPKTLHRAIKTGNISLQTAIKIENETDGRIRCIDLCSDEMLSA